MRFKCDSFLQQRQRITLLPLDGGITGKVVTDAPLTGVDLNGAAKDLFCIGHAIPSPHRVGEMDPVLRIVRIIVHEIVSRLRSTRPVFRIDLKTDEQVSRPQVTAELRRQALENGQSLTGHAQFIVALGG